MKFWLLSAILATLKKGKTFKIKATVAGLKSKKKIIGHAAQLRYRSSAKKIAAVDKNGKVTAKKKGTCTIYVYAVNGI